MSVIAEVRLRAYPLDKFPYAAEQPRKWNVGERMGAALRLGYEQQEAGQRAVDPQTGHAGPEVIFEGRTGTRSARARVVCIGGFAGCRRFA